MAGHRIYFLLLTLLSLQVGPACVGGGSSFSGLGPENAIGVPLPFQGAAAPDVMGPKADDGLTNGDEWTDPAVLSKGQRLLYGAAPQSAAVMDPDTDPVMLTLPNGGSLNLLVEISLDGTTWRSDLTGPYVRIVYLPLGANGQLSLNGLFRDVELNGKNAQGWNAVFDNLNLAPGEISVWYYEYAEMPVTKQNWDDAIFLPPLLHVPFLEEMTPISFADFWNFAAEPFTRLLGRFRLTAVRYWTQPTQTTWQPVPQVLY